MVKVNPKDPPLYGPSKIFTTALKAIQSISYSRIATESVDDGHVKL